MDYRVSLLTFFLGLILGHRFALGRDKRKEFNSAASELEGKVYDFLETSNRSYLPTKKELILFAPHLSHFKRKNYLNMVSKLYQSIKSDTDAFQFDPVKGEVVQNNEYVSKTRDHVLSLKKFFARK